MKKMLCPYCDHEMTKKGSCDFCGSRVKKPVYVETTAEFSSQPSAQPNECDCRLHSEDEHDHDDTYRDSEDVSFRQDYEASYGAGVQQTPPAQTGAGQPRRRAMLASEAVSEAARQGSDAAGGMSKTAKVVIKVVIVYAIIQILLSVLVTIFL